MCWRCGWPILDGQEWEAGHTVPKHLGGTEVRPEHKICNRADGHRQTKIAAKIKRMQKKGFDGRPVERKPSRLRSRGFQKPDGYRYDWRLGRWVKTM